MTGIILFGCFALFLIMGVPVAIALGAAEAVIYRLRRFWRLRLSSGVLPICLWLLRRFGGVHSVYPVVFVKQHFDSLLFGDFLPLNDLIVPPFYDYFMTKLKILLKLGI